MGQVVRQVPVSTSSTGGLRFDELVLAANNQRKSFTLQNQKAEELYVKFGSAASTSDYHLTLTACGAAADGTGGVLTDDHCTQAIYVKPASGLPSYTAVEFI
jgi:hypothetical protein|tara:strand:+ start:274 stop:579 length:306 start_codon:yes stop_codon:yes gene_type:complete